MEVGLTPDDVPAVAGKSNAGVVCVVGRFAFIQLILLNEFFAAFGDGLVVHGEDFSGAVTGSDEPYDQVLGDGHKVAEPADYELLAAAVFGADLGDLI